MIEHDDERVGKVLRRLLRQQRQRSVRTGCPDEESLADYLGGLLTEDARQEIEAHLAACTFCVDDLVAVNKAAQDNVTEAVPQRVIDRAMALVRPPERESFLDLVVRVVRDSIELVSTTGSLVFAPVPVAVRGRAQAAESNILQVEKELGKFKVSVEVERVEAGMCQVAVKVTGRDGKPSEGIRVSLISGKREQASFLTRQGRAVFDGISRGEYSLTLPEPHGSAGTIRLRIEEESS